VVLGGAAGRVVVGVGAPDCVVAIEAALLVTALAPPVDAGAAGFEPRCARSGCWGCECLAAMVVVVSAGVVIAGAAAARVVLEAGEDDPHPAATSEMATRPVAREKLSRGVGRLHRIV
jgi:hypothetical protein